jgi:hypothetical protein
MRRAPLLAVVLLAGLTISCEDAPTAVQVDAVQTLQSDARLSPTPLLAAKGNPASVEWRPFEFTVEGCDESVLVKGFSHNLSKNQVRGKAGPTSFLMVSAQGFGEGLDSGAKYVFSDKITYSQGGEIEGGTVVGASRQFQLIGQGPVPNLHFYGVVKITLYEDGQVEIDLAESQEICK